MALLAAMAAIALTSDLTRSRGDKRMKILYFAALREQIGHGEEDVVLPDKVHTVGDLMGWLAGRDEVFAAAFVEPSVVRAAVDQALADPDTSVRGAQEVAFFPPMTGG